MKKLTIIELISPGENWGGIEQHILDLSKGLKERGHQVVFASRAMEHAVAKYAAVGEVHAVPVRNALDLGTIRTVARLIRAVQADIVHTHTSRDAWMALFATMLAGRAKAVTTRHVPLAAKKDVLHSWFYNRLAAIICVSRYVREIFLSSRPDIDASKVTVAYPSIDLAKFTAGSRERFRELWGVGEDDFLVGFVGRVTWEKGLDDLLAAAALVKDDFPSLKLAVIGMVNADTPEYLDKLKSYAVDSGLGDRVVFQGITPDVADVMHAIDCLAAPSVIPETFGLVLCEALAAGRPAIATATGAQGEIVDDGINGILVPARDSVKLAAAIGRLAGDRGLARRMGEAGQRDILNRFGADSTLNAVEDCFYRVTGR